MKKIPTLFKRVFTKDHKKTILNEVTPGLEWVLRGEGKATVKWDGACCAIINGELYKRYDAKNGKKPPEGAIPCQPEPDPVTGHWPHWVKCSTANPADQYFLSAFKNRQRIADILPLTDGTYEAIGIHWQSNPYDLAGDTLRPHGDIVIPNWCLSKQRYELKFCKKSLFDLPYIDENERSFESIRAYLERHPKYEGLVFWKDGEPKCKIKRSDFRFPWPVKP